MAAQQYQVLHTCQFFDPLLGQGLALGGQINQMVGHIPRPLANRLVAVIYRLGLHHHTHTAAVGCVVHIPVLILCIGPNIRGLDLHFAGLACPANNALVQHGATHVREQGHNINPHQKVLS